MSPEYSLETLTGGQIAPFVPALSKLRVEVFREWPYLYQGDEAAEADYLGDFAVCRDAVLVLAEAAGEIVGASTGAALTAHHDNFADPIAAAGIDPNATFYFAESVLLPDHRGEGIGHAFFDAREAHARSLGYARACFCAVIRPQDHPMRPANARSLEPFWSARGYSKLDGVVASLDWRDVGDAAETEKQLQFYMADL